MNPRGPSPKPRKSAKHGGARAAASGGRAEAGPMRVQRALARAGLASRRAADQAVAEGRVKVNGLTAVIGQVVDPLRDKITLDGKPIPAPVATHKWMVLNKPAGVMTTRRDPQGRQTVFDLVDDVPGLVYVGRLDFMTEGVLLLTTDGSAAHALTHPSRGVERSYAVTVRGDARSAARLARRGVELDDGLVLPVDVKSEPIGGRRSLLELTITEGRTHEVRRLCDALGLEVERLVRTRYGPVKLGDLASGATRPLSVRERNMIEAL